MDNTRFRERITIYGLVVLVFFLVLIIHLFRIQVLMHEHFSNRSYRQIRSFYTEKGKRGKILASSGEELAYDTYESDLIIDPQRFIDFDKKYEVLNFLKNYKELNIQDEISNLEKLKDKRYYKLITGLNSNERNELEVFFKKINLRQNEIFFEKNNKRIYNSDDMFRPVIGFVGYSKDDTNEITGKFGIEKTYNEELNSQEISIERYLSANRRREIPVISKEKNNLEKNGNNVVLTIDYILQYILYQESLKFYEEYEPEWLSGIIVNPQNGEILAMVSLPKTDIANSRNNNIQNRYEPGSVFKGLIVAAALEEGFVKTDEIFDNSKGSITKFGSTIRDSTWRTLGNLTLKDIIRLSSNIGMVKIAEKIPNDIYEYYLKAFGLYEKTNIELSGEINIPQQSYTRWDGLKKYSMSFGQGIAITPIQMAMSFATTINGGTLYKPQIVKSIIDENNDIVFQNEPQIIRNVISENTSQIIRNMHREVVESGTGRQAKIDGYDIGGKTGTSQKSVGGTYSREKFIISFAGFYPVDKPEFLLLLVADEPKSKDGETYGGGTLMAPLSKNIMKRMFKYKNILPKNMEAVTLDKNFDELKNKNIDFELENMPELTNLTIQDISRIFESKKINLEIHGKGLVYKQEPEAGTNIENIEKVTIYLKEH